MNRWIKGAAPCIAGLLLAAPGYTATDYSEVRRDVEVMSRALLAAGDDGDGIPAISRIEGSYLAGQGIVLRLAAHRLGAHGVFPSIHGGDFEAFGEDIGAFVEDILTEVEISLEGLDASLTGLPLDELQTRRVVVIDDGELGEINADLLRELANKQKLAAVEVRAARKEQASVRREYAEAQRQYEKSLEEYQEKVEEGADEAEAQSVYEQAEAAMENARERYRKGRKAYKVQLEVAREEQALERKQKIAELATATLDNFCRYGTSLRSLPDEEHITLVFERMGEAESQEDLYYVIDKEDHAACLSGDIGGQELAERAISYRF